MDIAHPSHDRVRSALMRACAGLAFVLAASAAAGCGPVDVGTALRTGKLGPSFDYRMYVSGEFAGEDFVIEEIVTCKPKRLSGGIGGGSRLSYSPTRKSFGLQFGRRALFVSTVNVCGAVADARFSAARALADGFEPTGKYSLAPLIYSIDDYESPTEVTVHLREIGESFSGVAIKSAYGDFDNLALTTGSSQMLLDDRFDPRGKFVGAGGVLLVHLGPDESTEAINRENSETVSTLFSRLMNGKVLVSYDLGFKGRFNYYYAARNILDKSYETKQYDNAIEATDIGVRNITYTRLVQNKARFLKWPSGDVEIFNPNINKYSGTIIENNNSSYEIISVYFSL